MGALSDAGGRTERAWVRYTWDLETLRCSGVRPPGYDLRHAAPGELRLALALALDAYGSDPVWGPMMEGIKQRMTERVKETFGRPDAAYVFAERSGIPIGVSGVATHHWTDQHLLTGICVLPGHRRRGVGRSLLAESLSWLRAQHLVQAQVYTLQGSLADEKVYRLFGSTRVVGVAYPGLRRPPAREGASS